MSREVFICDAVRTPIGRFGGSLSAVRADDLAAVPLKALVERNPGVDWSALDEVFLGCANQAGEDNRNVARMALLLAGLPESVPGVTLNRLCASGMDAIGTAFRAIACGEMELAIAGGVESMSRAPYVMGKADSAFGRGQKIEDTTIGWRFVNPLMKEQYGIDPMPQTADNVADDYRRRGAWRPRAEPFRPLAGNCLSNITTMPIGCGSVPCTSPCTSAHTCFPGCPCSAWRSPRRPRRRARA